LRFHKLREEFDVLLAPVLLVIMSNHHAFLLLLSLPYVPLDLVRDIEEVLLGDFLEKLLVRLVFHVDVHEVTEFPHVWDNTIDDLCKFQVSP
jgi:hypothetical protein